MRYVEVQLRGERLTDLFRESVRDLDLSTSSSFGAAAFELILDHVEIGEAHLAAGDPLTHELIWEDESHDEHRDRVDTHEIKIEQALLLAGKVLVGRGTSAPSLEDLPKMPATVSMAFSASVDAAGTPTLALGPKYVQVAVPSNAPGSQWDRDALTATVEARIRAMIPTRPIPLPEKELKRLGMTITSVGVATDAGFGRVAIRLQGMPRLEREVEEWQAFHSGAFEDPFGGSANGPFDWALLIDSNTMQDMIAWGVQENLGKHEEVYLKSGVGAHWNGAGSRAAFDVEFGADISVGPVTPGVHVDSHVLLEAVPDGLLQETTTTAVKVDTGTRVLIGTLIDFALPVIGRAVLEIIQLTMAPGTASGFAGAIMGGLLSNSPIPFAGDDAPGDDWSCKKISDSTQVCTMSGSIPFSLSDDQKLVMHLDSVIGVEDALIERGRLIAPPPLPDPGIDSIGANGPTWLAPEIPCARAGNAGAELAKMLDDPLASFKAGATIDIVFKAGRASRLLAATLVSADPAGVLKTSDVEAANNSTTIRLGFISNAAYEAAPYPFSMLVQTSAGTRLVTVDPIPQLTNELAKELVVQALGSLAECFSKEDDFYKHFHRQNPKWAVDPGIDAKELLSRSWQLFHQQLTAHAVKPIERIR